MKKFLLIIILLIIIIGGYFLITNGFQNSNSKNVDQNNTAEVDEKEEARNLRIKMGINEIKTKVEMNYGMKGYTNLDANSETYSDLKSTIIESGGSNLNINSLNSKQDYVIYVTLSDGNTVYCVDSAGNASELPSPPEKGKLCSGNIPNSNN